MSAKTKEPASDVIVAYKGFNADWTCRGFQYEVGKTYKHDGEVVACKSGFHACTHPLDVFGYYPPTTSKFARVELSGEIGREGDGDSKVAAAEIAIKAEIHLPELIEATVKHVFDAAKWLNGSKASGDWGAASASGDWGAASASGYQGAALASACRGAALASGSRGAASASGDWGAALASGDWGAASASGFRGSASASGFRGAALASGYQGAALASGTRGAALASGSRGAALASGYQGRASGRCGSAVFLVERDDDGLILSVWAGIVGRDGIKADTWYTLKDGSPVEVNQ